MNPTAQLDTVYNTCVLQVANIGNSDCRVSEVLLDGF